MSNTSLLVAVFWIGVFGTLYAYVGFPLLITCLAGRRGRQRHSSTEIPNVPITVIITAYNEEENIGARIRNVLDSDYPVSLLDVIVVSDASTDRTNEIVRDFRFQGVRLIVQTIRQGKSVGLNRAVAVSSGDVVVFTDANTFYAKETLATLVRHFQKSRVGLVSGYTRYTAEETGQTGHATDAYASFERAIKRAESRWGCCVGADGAIFAMRRSLYRELRDDDINDFVLPLGVVEQGYYCVLADEAVCFEKPGKSLESEFRRQSRITNRSLRALWRNARLLNPFRFRAFAFCLFSHKVIRFLVPILLVLSAATLLALAASQPSYRGAAVVAGCGTVLLAAWWALSGPSRQGRLFRVVTAFLVINVAMLVGWVRFLAGQGDATWSHDRSASSGVRPGVRS